MKKAILISILLCSVVYAADVVITLTIPQDYTIRFRDMMQQWSNCHIIIEVRGNTSENQDYHAKWDITDAIPPEDPNTENPQQFGKRFIRQFMVECLKAHEKVTADAETKAKHDAIVPVEPNVPDGAMQ